MHILVKLKHSIHLSEEIQNNQQITTIKIRKQLLIPSASHAEVASPAPWKLVEQSNDEWPEKEEDANIKFLLLCLCFRI